MSETLYDLEARMREVELRQRSAAQRATRILHRPPPSRRRHRLAEQLRSVADRLES